MKFRIERQEVFSEIFFGGGSSLGGSRDIPAVAGRSSGESASAEGQPPFLFASGAASYGAPPEGICLVSSFGGGAMVGGGCALTICGREMDVRCREMAVRSFGLTADELAALKNRIAADAEVVQSPRAATIKISTATEAIAARFAAADELLSLTLDKLAPRFQKSAPDFFSAYEGARVIVDAASPRKAPAPAPAPAIGSTQKAEPALAGVRG